MGFRPDEAEQIKTWLARSRPDLLTRGWEARAVRCEQTVALAAWRSRLMGDRVHAIIDALDVTREPVTFPIRYRKWGDETA